MFSKKILFQIGVWPYAKRVNTPYKKARVWIVSIFYRLYLTLLSPLFSLKKKSVFFIVGYPRSGSTLFLSYLNSHPDIHCINEPLDGSVYWGFSNQISSPEAAMKHLKKSILGGFQKSRGGKLFLGQLGNLGLSIDDITKTFPGGKYIILYRSDLLEQFLSLHIAMQAGEFAWYPGYEKKERTLWINPQQLENYYSRMSKDYKELAKKLDGNSILVSYEALCSNPEEVLEETVLPYLGNDSRELVTSMVKQNHWDYEKTITNYEDVKHLIESESRYLRF